MGSTRKRLWFWTGRKASWRKGFEEAMTFKKRPEEGESVHWAEIFRERAFQEKGIRNLVSGSKRTSSS
jgi:hypothetical protein